ncbi:MAG: hypothetical protein WD294_11835, partial [Phycisphaeraceae bacterium]
MVATIDEAVAIIARVASLPGNADYLADTQRGLRLAGVTAAVATRNIPALYRWFMDGFSYQAISDQTALAYIANHGNADWPTVETLLGARDHRCPKLTDFGSYRGCRYRKSAWTCGNPETLPTCPVPSLPLRKGILNEQAFSLFLFIRDRCAGDLVGFIDSVIASAGEGSDRTAAQREALLDAIGEVQGVSRKLMSMMLSMLLVADPNRPHWVPIGQSMVAIDSLVHNFLHRTGILAAYGASHPYGQRCFSRTGCESIIRDLADRFDARTVNSEFPRSFPRMVQHAIWRFCAIGELDVCNGKNIRRDRFCALTWCPLWSMCSRLPLVAPEPPAG